MSLYWDDEGDPYYRVTYLIEYDIETHIREILDQGYYHKDYQGGSGELKQAVDEENKKMRRPVLLDGNIGDLADPGPHYLKFQTKFARTWAPLDLPTTPFPTGE